VGVGVTRSAAARAAAQQRRGVRQLRQRIRRIFNRIVRDEIQHILCAKADSEP
jgi:hypothetical protein